MFGLSDLELVVILAFCVGLLAVLEEWIRPATLFAFVLTVVLVTIAGWLSRYRAISTFEAKAGVHYQWYLGAASMAFALAAFAVVRRATASRSRFLRALLQWAMTPLFLAALVRLGAAFSSYSLHDFADLRSILFVSIVIPLASLTACHYERLQKPAALDHIRQAAFLYVPLFVHGSTLFHYDDIVVFYPQYRGFYLDREWLLVIAIILNAGVLVFWHQLYPDRELAV